MKMNLIKNYFQEVEKIPPPTKIKSYQNTIKLKILASNFDEFLKKKIQLKKIVKISNNKLTQTNFINKNKLIQTSKYQNLILENLDLINSNLLNNIKHFIFNYKYSISLGILFSSWLIYKKF